MTKRFFTIEAAHKKLPSTRKSLSKLQKLKQAIDAIASVSIDPKETAFEEILETNTKLSKDYHKLSYEFYKELENLEIRGCILKNLEEGLVDFYHKHESRDVFLCWKFGEEKIKAWHEIDAGFAGRKPIVDLRNVKNENKNQLA